MHLVKNGVDGRLFGRDSFPSFGVGGAASRGFGDSQITVTLRLQGGGEVVIADRAPDEPYQPGERIFLFGGVDIDTKSRAVLVDKFEHLRNRPPALDEA